ncbi:MAG: 4-hydroxy-tetrahydrodipicolinate reductase, partial [Candidatus Thiodiazotropha sp. (ex Notomyrtea botanica)]|nr:4-hydroxy-tetrahydrodipicolinate reductase [Candidatus Thiodiazotropha sp. (ex Notomyrtea botanica)]
MVMTRIAVVGAAGRMGKSLVQAVTEADGLVMGAATERPGSEAIGRDVGELAGVSRLDVIVTSDLQA